MTKQEFIQELQSALKGNMHDFEISTNVNYYNDYFNTKINEGMSEEEICVQLGSPRLIAKTLIDTSEIPVGSSTVNEKSDNNAQNEEHDKKRFSFREVFLKLLFNRESMSLLEKTVAILTVVVGVILFFALMFLVFTVVQFVFPILMLLMVITLLIKMFRRR